MSRSKSPARSCSRVITARSRFATFASGRSGAEDVMNGDSMSFDIRSSRFRELLPGGAALEKIAEGFQFTEGPLWDSRKGCLLFSDILGNRIYRWSPREGVSVWREPSGKSNGLTFDPEGRL